MADDVKAVPDILDETAIAVDDPKVAALLKELQGNILRAFARDNVALVFLSFKAHQEPAAKKYLGKFCQTNLHSAWEQEQFRDTRANRGGLRVNVFLAKAFYDTDRKLHTPDDPAFLRDKSSTRELLNDPPFAEWDAGYHQHKALRTIHALVSLAHDDPDQLTAARNELCSGIADFADMIVEDGKVIRMDENTTAHEHFGFVDGRSQPRFFEDEIEGELADQTKARGARRYSSAARLGLVLAKDPNNSSNNAYGSYVVFRKLEQDVEAFKALTARLADTLKLNGAQGQELATAYVLGRFKDGTPVVSNDRSGGANPLTNGFDYSDDNFGRKCPIQAHIRVANPREKTAREEDQRIVRRGIPYGGSTGDPRDLVDSLVSGSTTAGGDKKGLLFLCFQSSIEKQYEAIQTRSNDITNGLDPIIGQAKTTNNPFAAQTWPLHWGGAYEDNERFLFDGRQIVAMRASEYFFAPSIGFLTGLARA